MSISFFSGQEPRASIQPTQSYLDAETTFFNLSNYQLLFVSNDYGTGIRAAVVASDFPTAFPG
ncbi:hypothetical protein [Arthrobacter psychrochitiniphilus]|uniref:hypothetical protein n=1 Tax=Arthrobacter psychrochitiniphilus TaxID=291045 RepID=UPI0011B3FD3F|nr:hypothetical protein [Arthrobacter psychrochitiniphilus]NYG16589.1 hypothetical protein [Arthrobacter psychrochitiniphilus]